MISKKEFEYTVGRNLAKYRNEKKLTQMQVAEMAELSVPFYASVELGNKGLSAYSLYKLSAALGVDINCLLSDDIPDERAKNIEALLSGKTERVKLAAEKIGRTACRKHRVRSKINSQKIKRGRLYGTCCTSRRNYSPAVQRNIQEACGLCRYSSRSTPKELPTMCRL